MDIGIPMGVASRLETANLLLQEGSSTYLQIRNLGDTAYRNLQLLYLQVNGGIDMIDGKSIIPGASPTSRYMLQSHNGVSQVDNVVLRGGFAEIKRMKLIRGLYENYAYFYDDFWGDVLSDLWADQAETGSIAIQSALDNGVLRIITGAGANDDHSVTWGAIRPYDPAKVIHFECRARSETDVVIDAMIGLFEDVNDNICWYLNESDNFYAYNIDGGVATTTDTGIPIDTDWHTFAIEIDGTDVRYYLDGTLEATHTTNIPTERMEPRFWIETKDAVLKNLDIDYVCIMQER